MDGRDVNINSPTEFIQHIEAGTKWQAIWNVIFKYIILVKYMSIVIQIPLKYVPNGQLKNISISSDTGLSHQNLLTAVLFKLTYTFFVCVQRKYFIVKPRLIFYRNQWFVTLCPILMRKKEFL